MDELRKLDNANEIGRKMEMPARRVLEEARNGLIPGVKYGKRWRFYWPDVLEAHRRNCTHNVNLPEGA